MLVPVMHNQLFHWDEAISIASKVLLSCLVSIARFQNWRVKSMNLNLQSSVQPAAGRDLASRGSVENS
jgi:hypothetical protein